MSVETDTHLRDPFASGDYTLCGYRIGSNHRGFIQVPPENVLAEGDPGCKMCRGAVRDRAHHANVAPDDCGCETGELLKALAEVDGARGPESVLKDLIEKAEQWDALERSLASLPEEVQDLVRGAGVADALETSG